MSLEFLACRDVSSDHFDAPPGDLALLLIGGRCLKVKTWELVDGLEGKTAVQCLQSLHVSQPLIVADTNVLQIYN